MQRKFSQPSSVPSNNRLSIAPWLLLTILNAVAQEDPKPATAAVLAPIPPALGLPKPGPTNDAPYAPQPILQGGAFFS
jgi:hypothetical protein